MNFIKSVSKSLYYTVQLTKKVDSSGYKVQVCDATKAETG
ncbi:MAG: hypothetical protein JWR87_3971 [Segetibacter sp.]|jgi:hypothetical protein|nr:hypothetical protein [Segetibacter sp.]